MTLDHPMAQRCSAHNRRGNRCGEWAQRGQGVCHLHGGKSPQALRKADERLRELVHPAISRLGDLIEKADSDAVSLNAVKYVLEFAGFRSETVAQTDSSVTVTVHFDTPTVALDAAYDS